MGKITVHNGLSTEQKLILDKWEKKATSEEAVSREQIGKLLRSSPRSTVGLELECSKLSRHPPCLEAFSSLISLSLVDNRLTKVPTKWFSRLPHLKEVDLSSNQIDAFPRSGSRLATLSRLSKLNLSFNKLENRPALEGLPDLRVILIGNPCALTLQNKELQNKKILYEVCCTYFDVIKRKDFTSLALKDANFKISADYFIRLFSYLKVLFDSAKSSRLLSLLQRTYSLLEEMMSRRLVRQVFYLTSAELQKVDTQVDSQNGTVIEFWVANALYWLEQAFCYFVPNPYPILVQNSRRLFASFIAEAEVLRQYEKSMPLSQEYEDANHFRVLLMEKVTPLLIGYFLRDVEGVVLLSPKSPRNAFRALANTTSSMITTASEEDKQNFVLNFLYKSRAWQDYLVMVLGNKADVALPKEMRILRKILSVQRTQNPKLEGESEEKYKQKIVLAAFMKFILPEL